MSKDYIVHKAVEARKVVPKKRREELTIEYISANYYAEAKYDGCQAIVIVYSDPAAEPLILSRTGEEYIGPMPAARQLRDLCGHGVYFCEAWWPGADQFNLINGAFRKGVENDRLRLVVFDRVDYDEFHAGYSARSYMDRTDIPGIQCDNPDYPLVQRAACFYPGTYGNIQEFCNELVDCGGYDGVVAKLPHGTWTKGKDNGDEQIKIKRKLSFDLRVTEVNVVKGEKTGRDVYKLVVDFRGRSLGVGSGLPHQLCDCPSVGDIVEVEAMDYSAEGLLREPRYKGIRHDKVQPDV